MRNLLLQLVLALGLASCTLERALPPATAGPLDSLVRARIGLSTGKVKFNGPVTIQLGGTGNTAQAQDFTKAGQHGGAVATAPGATAGATTRTGLPTWQLVVGALVVLLLLLLGLAYKFRPSLLKISG